MADNIKGLGALNLKSSYSLLNASKLALKPEAQQTEKVKPEAQTRSEKMPGYDPKKAQEKAATDFEALLLQDMLKSMWSAEVPKDGMLTGSREEEQYRDMLNEALSKNIAEHKSVGIRDVIMREFAAKEPKAKK